MVTIFKNFNEVVEHKSISTILEEIKAGKYRPGIIYLRKSLAENKTEAYNKAKKSLPAFTPSGKFVGGRKLEFLANYSSCIILDIDKLSAADLQNAKHLANQSEFTYASFISPSGNGLKILVKINSDKADHKEAFLLVQAHYESILKLEIDKSGKDLTRLCFYSYDENLYYNENAKIFSVTEQEKEPKANIERELKRTEPTIVINSDAIYNHCVNFTEKKVQFVNGSRNVFVHQLACNLNRKGVSLQEALGYILTDFGYDEKEVTQAVNSAYGNSHEFGKNEKYEAPKNPTPKTQKPTTIIEDEDDEDKPKPTQIDRLELFLSNKYVFRHNMVSGKLEFQYFGKKKWNVMNDFIENSMLRECLKGRIKTNLSSLRNLLYSDFCVLFNPFEDYFFNLP
ncbi:MAG TPA: BT4734/BF3469 family protein, partial [Flavobacterium lutivivi]|nr:BT4734/BF3469 family protein [Flavobacterium lutivivi]